MTTKKNPYAGAADNFTEEDWDRILGKWVNTPLSAAAAKVVWNEHLAHLAPIEVHNSLHIIENVFMLNGLRHSCTWPIGSDGLPGISIQQRRPHKKVAAEVPTAPFQRHTKEHREHLGDKLFPSTTAFAVAMSKVPELHGVTISLQHITQVELIGKLARELIKVYEDSLRPYQ